MKKFIESVEKSINFVNQFSEYNVETKIDDSPVIGKSEVTFIVYPVTSGIFSEVVLNILIDVCRRFGLSYFITFDMINIKLKFVMYTVYDYKITKD